MATYKPKYKPGDLLYNKWWEVWMLVDSIHKHPETRDPYYCIKNVCELDSYIGVSTTKCSTFDTDLGAIGYCVNYGSGLMAKLLYLPEGLVFPEIPTLPEYE